MTKNPDGVLRDGETIDDVPGYPENVETPTEWVNYGDCNPFDHGGCWVKWTGDDWKVVRTSPPQNFPEDMCQGNHALETFRYSKRDVWDGGDPERGFSDRAKEYADSAHGDLGPIQIIVDDQVAWLIGGFAIYEEFTDPDRWIEPHLYWGVLELDYGIERTDN